MCRCFIIPRSVLTQLARDESLTEQERQHLSHTAALDGHWRKVRGLMQGAAAEAAQALSSGVAVASKPAITVYDCKNSTTLPGRVVSSPAKSTDTTASRAFTATTAVADFYQQVFQRNSVDNLGMTLLSSIHYGVKYNNAFWNGSQMTYGDGDGGLFLDFTLGSDVIGHELTHGVTQFTAKLGYTSEAGGLNESISDVFGSMFRQWRLQQTADQADWLIGKDIMGPKALAKGYTCLRDMAHPDATHCLSAQPTHYSQFKSSMDPHESSGIPNLAFCRAAVALGGYSWAKAGQIWYQALTAFGSSPRMKMKTFADRTRKVASTLYPNEAAVFAAVDHAWRSVGL